MSDMAVIGDKDSVLGFKALGLAVETTDDPVAAGFIIHRLAKSGTAVIFITERLASRMPETLDKYKNAVTPAIIPIPGVEGSLGFAMSSLQHNVETAVGVNIFVNEEEGK